MRILVLRLIEGFLQRALSLPTTAEALANRYIKSLRIDPSFEKIESRYVSSSTISAGFSTTIMTGMGRGELGLEGETEISETGNLIKRLEWRDRDETWWVK